MTAPSFVVGEPVSALVATEEGMDLARGTVARITPIEGGRQLVLVNIAGGGQVQYANHTGSIVKEAS